MQKTVNFMRHETEEKAFQEITCLWAEGYVWPNNYMQEETLHVLRTSFPMVVARAKSESK